MAIMGDFYRGVKSACPPHTRDLDRGEIQVFKWILSDGREVNHVAIFGISQTRLLDNRLITGLHRDLQLSRMSILNHIESLKSKLVSKRRDRLPTFIVHGRRRSRSLGRPFAGIQV